MTKEGSACSITTTQVLILSGSKASMCHKLLCGYLKDVGIPGSELLVHPISVGINQHANAAV